jgi:hypothetical protein
MASAPSRSTSGEELIAAHLIAVFAAIVIAILIGGRLAD